MGFIIGGRGTLPATVYSATNILTLQPARSVTDSSGNVYITGYSYLGRTYPSACVVKFNSSGTLQWTKQLNNSVYGGTDSYAAGIALDSSNNVYIVGNTSVQDGANVKTGGFLAKFDTNGNSQFTQYMADQGYGYTRFNSIVIDSSNNIFVSGPSDDLDSNYANTKTLIVKYNTSGVVQSTKAISTGIGSKISMSVMTMDSTGNFYLTGYTAPDYPSKYTWVTYKLDSTASILWSKQYSNSSYYVYGQTIAVDSSGNVYNAGTQNGDIYLVKFDSSGSVLWQQQLATATDDSPQKIAFDSSNNVYLLGRTSDTSPGSSYDMFIVKYNSSGALQWQRKFVSSPDAEYASDLTIDSNNILCITGTLNGSNALYLKLPSDGSLTGSYTINGISVTYDVSAFTDSASSISFGGISSSVADRTKNTGDMSTAAPASSTSLTSAVTTLATVAGAVIPSGAYMSGVAGGMYLSDYVAPTFIPTTRAMIAFGNRGPENTTNLVDATGIVSADSSGVGTARETCAGASFGGDKGIFGYGKTGTYAFNVTSVTNKVSNTGVMAADTTGVGTTRHALAAAGYGTDKVIFGYGIDSTSTLTAVTNLVSNTGVVATDTAGVGVGRYYLAAASYGTDKALFGFGQLTGTSVYTTNRSLVSNTGVVAAQTGGSGTGRSSLAGASYGTDKAIFGYGSTSSGAAVYYNTSNKVSNTGVVAADTAGVGTSRMGLAASGYGSDKAFFGFGNPASGVLKTMNLVSNTGVVATDTSSGGSARSRVTAAGFAQ